MNTIVGVSFLLRETKIGRRKYDFQTANEPDDRDSISKSSESLWAFQGWKYPPEPFGTAHRTKHKPFIEK